MTAKVLFGIESKSEHFRSLVARASVAGLYYEFNGGLGDVIVRASNSDVFRRLNALAGDEEMLIVLFCHNPHTHELFSFHQNSKRLTILMLGYSDYRDPAYRAKHGLPERWPALTPSGDPLVPSISDDDRAYLSTLPKVFATLSLTASAGPADQRSIPREIATDLVGACLSVDVTPVVLGRSYRNIMVTDCSAGRSHTEEREIPGAIWSVDRLSAAGSIEALRRSVVNVSCESAMLVASWRMFCPTYFVASDATLELLLNRKTIITTEYGFGVPHPNDGYQSFQKYNRRHFLDYLSLRIAK